MCPRTACDLDEASGDDDLHEGFRDEVSAPASSQQGPYHDVGRYRDTSPIRNTHPSGNTIGFQA